MAENPEQDSALPVELDDSTPLHELAVEAHEMYQELKLVGFPERVIAQIIGQLLYNSLADNTVVAIQYDYDEEDDDEDDPENERN